jgi:hypothetical protein
VSYGESDLREQSCTKAAKSGRKDEANQICA